MTETFDEQQVLAWLQTLYGDTGGLINIVSTGNWAGQSFRTPEEAAQYVSLIEKRQPQGIYARVTTLKAALPKGRRGSVTDSAEFIGFYADLDIATGQHKWHVCDGDPCSGVDKPGHQVNFIPLIPDEAACLELVELTGLPAPTEWVHSGGGMYPWWLFESPRDISGDTMRTLYENKAAEFQRIIGLAAEKMGYHYGTGVGDLTRVLRIPGTVNRKDDAAPVRAEWRMDLSISTPYGQAQLIGAINSSLAKLEGPKPVHVSKPLAPPRVKQAGQSPGDAYAAAHTWHEILEADGCTVFSEKGSYTEWTRPGKDRRGGNSGTSNYKGGDVLHVFSDAWQPLRDGHNYTKFGYYTFTRFNGDFRAATRQLAAEGYGDPLPPRGTGDDDWCAESQHTPTATADVPGTVETAAAEPPPPVTPAPPRLPDDTAPAIYGWNDSGLADRLESRHGDEWKYVAARDRNGWLHWDGSVWVTDKRGGVLNQVDQIVRKAMATAQIDLARLDTESQKGEIKQQQELITKINAAGNNARQNGAAAIFGRRPRIAADADDFDLVTDRVTTCNGTLNLITGEFGEFDRTLLATKKLGACYDPAATAPRWNKFLEEVLPDPAMRDYLQRAAGYTLLGDPVRKALFLLHGASNTGKSQVIAALRDMFGGFHAGAKEQTFRQNESATAATPGLQKLRGARLVTASEFNKNTKIDEALIKQLAGGSDMIESRGLYADEESWKPQFAIWIATNHLPQFNADDDAIWKRVKPIHFPVVFGGDTGRTEIFDIGRTLAREEAPGILNWLLEGVKKYREHGLDEPTALVEGVAAYKQESDQVAQFVNQAIADGVVETDTDGQVESKLLYAWYVAWCGDQGYRYPYAANRFGMRLSKLGYGATHDTSGTKRMRTGLKATGNQWIATGLPLRT